jgi:hypothetical protein
VRIYFGKNPLLAYEAPYEFKKSILRPMREYTVFDPHRVGESWRHLIYTLYRELEPDPFEKPVNYYMNGIPFDMCLQFGEGGELVTGLRATLMGYSDEKRLPKVYTFDLNSAAVQAFDRYACSRRPRV